MSKPTNEELNKVYNEVSIGSGTPNLIMISIPGLGSCIISKRGLIVNGQQGTEEQVEQVRKFLMRKTT
jgi:hypothetical protein